ncbi:unnamed protein product [Linum trigynum]|uniref:Trichome birefringence-like C-terminal domain-containing protein n=1 Tax=Linum trigynum TaxID=586398 RepID=A0AAV2DII4_9ROSI
MFVGDSISRNQFESLICMIVPSLPRRTTQLNGGDPLSSIKFWNKSRCIHISCSREFWCRIWIFESYNGQAYHVRHQS